MCFCVIVDFDLKNDPRISPNRNAADHPSAHSDRRTPRHRANVPTPRNTWVQLRATSLVEPTCQSCEFPPTRLIHSPSAERSLTSSRFLSLLHRSGVKHCMQLLKSYIGALLNSEAPHPFARTKREKSARVTLCILTCFCKSCFFIFLFNLDFFFFFSFFWDDVLALGYFNSSLFHSYSIRTPEWFRPITARLCVPYKRWCVGMYWRNISTTRIKIIYLCCQIW